MPRRSRSRSPCYERQASRSPPRGGRGNGGGGGGRNGNGAQIYVARFSKDTRESDLRKAFERFGHILSVDVKYHGRFAFIVFEDPRDAEAAIDEMNGRCLPYDNDRIVVEMAGANRRRGRSRSPP